MKDSTIDVLFALVRAGLWEKDAYLASYSNIDYSDVCQLSQMQAVEGLVTAGLEHVADVKIPKENVLTFIGIALQVEQRNKAMNQFIADTVVIMQEAGIYTLLVKGQGIAQCYERPLWRISGDIDFFISKDNYQKAKDYLLSRSISNKPERSFSKELGMNIGPWYVEIHGSLRTGLSSKVDKAIDFVQKIVFNEGDVRSWRNGDTQVFLPGVDSDVFLVFTHFVKHFYKEGGLTLRQLCDWCRLLWTYRDKISIRLLENRLRQSGLMAEWLAFTAVAVDYLGMPVEAIPLYCEDKKWSQKADKIIDFILKGGEWRKLQDTLLVGRIFPLSTLRFAPGILLNVNWLKVKERLF